MNYTQYLEKGQTIESTESLIEKVINSQGQDENALQELVNRAQSQDSKAIEFLQMLQQQSGVSKFEEPSGPIVKKDQQDPNMPVAAETGTVDGRKYIYMPYQGEGPGASVERFKYQGADGNIYGMNVIHNGEGLPNDTAYVMNGLRYTDPEGQQVILNRQQAVTSNKCGGRVKKKALGSKLIKTQKAKCGCELKKVGGRLIEIDSCTGLPVHKVGGEVQKFEDGKTIWQKWWNKITEKPITSDHAKFGKTSIAFNNFKTTPRFNYIKDPLMQNIGTNVSAKPVDGYLPEDGKDWYRQYPTGTISTLATDKRLNAQFDENNRQKEFEESLQDPSMLPGEIQVMQEAMARNAEYDAQQAAQAQRVRTFYSKISDSDKRALQDMLKSAGYYKGEIDGVIGNGTLGALRKFQQDNKLTVDGMAGRLTFDALRAKTRQVAQPVTDPTVVPGYTQTMQLLNQMNGSVSTAPVKTGSPTGGMGLNDVRQGRDVQLVGPKVGLNLTAGLEIPQRKQGGQLNYANYLN